METRKIVIINSKTQSQKVIEASTATTLGELKAEMRQYGIDYSGMTFYEGHARVELKDDNSVLPSNIPYKGQVVNDLTFMLTAPEKKVKSGNMSRAEAYAEIKKRGLQSACVDKFGKNFTQCTTADLISLIEGNTVKSTPKKEEKPVEKPKAETKKEEPKAEAPKSSDDSCKKAISCLIEALYNTDTLDGDAYAEVKAILEGKEYKASEKMSKKEIDDMFSFVNN